MPSVVIYHPYVRSAVCGASFSSPCVSGERQLEDARPTFANVTGARIRIAMKLADLLLKIASAFYVFDRKER